MSASSSTIRMSDAIGYPLVAAVEAVIGFATGRHALAPLLNFDDFRFVGGAVHRHRQANHCAGHLARLVAGIVQLDPATMLLGGALYDREPEPCAFRARGDIGFRQPVTVLGGQAAAIVHHLDDKARTLLLHTGENTTL